MASTTPLFLQGNQTLVSLGGQGSDPHLNAVNVTTPSVGTSVVLYKNAGSGSTANSTIFAKIDCSAVGSYQFGDIRVPGGLTAIMINAGAAVTLSVR